MYKLSQVVRTYSDEYLVDILGMLRIREAIMDFGYSNGVIGNDVYLSFKNMVDIIEAEAARRVELAGKTNFSNSTSRI